jgi:hypothetical protein
MTFHTGRWFWALIEWAAIVAVIYLIVLVRCLRARRKWKNYRREDHRHADPNTYFNDWR